MLLIPTDGATDSLEYFVNKSAPEDLVLRLYVSNTTPAAGDTAASYTEASGHGYAAQTLSGAGWDVVPASDPTAIAYAERTFAFTGALGAVYGYFLTRSGSGRIAFAERFTNGPYNIQNNGDNIKITPIITCN